MRKGIASAGIVIAGIIIVGLIYLFLPKCEKTYWMSELEHNGNISILNATLEVECLQVPSGNIQYKILDNKTQEYVDEGIVFFLGTTSDGYYNFIINTTSVLPGRFYYLYYKLPGETEFLRRSFYGDTETKSCNLKAVNMTCAIPSNNTRRGYEFTEAGCVNVVINDCGFLPYYTLRECESECLE